MKRLIAERSVLYLGRMYAPGDALPASDGIMVAAWLRAKSAKWTGEAAEPQQSAQEDAAKTDGSQDIAVRLAPHRLLLRSRGDPLRGDLPAAR